MHLKNSLKSIVLILCLLLFSTGNAKDQSFSTISRLNKAQKQFLKAELREKGIRYLFENDIITIESSFSTYTLGEKKLGVRLYYEFNFEGQISGPYLEVIYSGFGEINASSLRGSYQVNRDLVIGKFVFDNKETRIRAIDDKYNEGNFIERYRLDLGEEDLTFFKNLKAENVVEYSMLGGKERLIYKSSIRADRRKFVSTIEKLFASLEIVKSKEFQKEWVALK